MRIIQTSDGSTTTAVQPVERPTTPKPFQEPFMAPKRASRLAHFNLRMVDAEAPDCDLTPSFHRFWRAYQQSAEPKTLKSYLIIEREQARTPALKEKTKRKEGSNLWVQHHGLLKVKVQRRLPTNMNLFFLQRTEYAIFILIALCLKIKSISSSISSLNFPVSAVLPMGISRNLWLTFSLNHLQTYLYATPNYIQNGKNLQTTLRRYNGLFWDDIHVKIRNKHLVWSRWSVLEEFYC